MTTRLSQTVNQIVPNTISSHIPVLNNIQQSSLKSTYHCHICFSKYPIQEAWPLTECHHQFCVECIKQFIVNKINHGHVNLKCFYPIPPNDKPCGQIISSIDIHQLCTEETWNKYQKFKSNLENTYSRQCPYCDHTQIGHPDHPIITCENIDCLKLYCLYHSNAHSMEINCEQYELSVAKETKMNEMAIHEFGDKCKSCPQCKFKIFKTGGCNHMKCVKCKCSWCWICSEIIEDTPIPNHYKDPQSQCKGQQFQGMDDELPPRWIIIVIATFMCIFLIPSTVLGIIFGLICYPFIYYFGKCEMEDGEKWNLKYTLMMFSIGFLLFFVIITVVTPLLIIKLLWSFVQCLYGLVRICCPCLPGYAETHDTERTNTEIEIENDIDISRNDDDLKENNDDEQEMNTMNNSEQPSNSGSKQELMLSVDNTSDKRQDSISFGSLKSEEYDDFGDELYKEEISHGILSAALTRNSSSIITELTE